MTPQEQNGIYEMLVRRANRPGTFTAVNGLRVTSIGDGCAEGEADLVLLDEIDDVVVMAEVKTRRVAVGCNTRVFPEEAVDAQKQRRYRRIASCYLMEHYPLKAIRFDAVGVTIRGGHIAEIEHQYNAFDWQVS